MTDNLKGLLAMAGSFQRFVDQNNIVLDRILKARAVHDSFLKNSNLSSMIEASRTLGVQIKLLESTKLLQSPALELANTVNLSISRLSELIDSGRIDNLLKQVTINQRIWEEQSQTIKKITEEFPRIDLVLQSHLAQISKFSVLSQVKISQLAWENIGDALDLQISTRNVLQNSFLDYTRSYSKLFNSWEKQPSLVLSLPPIISKFPAIEFFNGVDVIDSITIRKHEDIKSQGEDQRIGEVRREVGEGLEALLVELNSELIKLLQGARESLNSTNPDRVRHFTTSLRELFTHVLHTIAPDERVIGWNKTPEYYDKGRPTRRARLLYICRMFDQDPFSSFIVKDVDTVIVFLDLFQQGTHEVVSRYTPSQLKLMLVRMESILRFLLEIWRTS